MLKTGHLYFGLTYQAQFEQLANHGLERRDNDVDLGATALPDLALHARNLINEAEKTKVVGAQSLQQGEHLSAELLPIARAVQAIVQLDVSQLNDAVAVVGYLRLKLDKLFPGRGEYLQAAWKVVLAMPESA